MTSDDIIVTQNVTKVQDIISGTSKISDIVEIEDVLLFINQSEQEIEFLKNLKKYRVSTIDAKIKEREEQVEKLRDATKGFLVDNNKKTVEFPDVAKISVSKKKGTWVIEDQEKMLEALKKLNQYDKVVEETISIKKKDLNKVLDELEKNRNIPQGVKREEETSSMSITFNKNAEARLQQKEEAKQSTVSVVAHITPSVSKTSTDYNNLDI